MDNEKLNFLSKIVYFSELNSQEMLELASEFQWDTYPKGTLLLEQGQKASAVTLLNQGRVEIFNRNEDQHPSETYGPQMLFGELSIVTGKPAENSVRCLEDCRVLTMSAEDFARVLLRWPQIYRAIIRQLSQNLYEATQLLSENRYKEILRSAIKLTQYRDKFYGIWGSVKTTKEVERKFDELKQQSGNLLILGERGTGRQMVAWYAHQHLFGEAAPFVVVDGRRFEQQWGSMLTEPSNNSVHSNASLPYCSLFDIASGGTLFIQEIDHINPKIQLKLAETLKSYKKSCFIIGSIQAHPKETLQNVKITPELKECFVHTYSITPLRDRKRDIPVLAQGVLEKLAQKNHRKIPTLSPEATQLLLSHHYRQGNVTELIQVLERSFFLANKDIIGLEQIFFGPTSDKTGRKFNLLQVPIIEKLIKKGTILYWLRGISAALFIILILGLLFSPQVTPVMKVFTLVWGLWWPALAIISPFLGRLWCTVCPFSTIMDFVQTKFNPTHSVPAWIIKYDYLIVSVLFIFVFWIEIVTEMRSNPLYTALLLLTIQFAAILVSVLYPRHIWCRHFCPLGGFIGTASIGSILEVRSDPAVCLNKCTTFECYVGKDQIKGCPMSQHLPYLDNNLDCKLCFNCVRNCPQGSVQFNLRVPAREVWHLKRVNQGYTIFIGIMLAILFPIIYFEPLQRVWPSNQWHLWFSVAYFSSALLGGGIGWWIAKPFKTKAASMRIKMVFAFTPLVLAGHIMYQVDFIPGIHSFVLGAGYQSSIGLQTAFIPANLASQGLAAIIGISLTALTVLIILTRKTKRTI